MLAGLFPVVDPRRARPVVAARLVRSAQHQEPAEDCDANGRREESGGSWCWLESYHPLALDGDWRPNLPNELLRRADPSLFEWYRISCLLLGLVSFALVMHCSRKPCQPAEKSMPLIAVPQEPAASATTQAPTSTTCSTSSASRTHCGS